MNGGGELELRVDGTYTFSWEDIADVVEADGSLLTSSDVERGKWALSGGRVMFSPSDRLHDGHMKHKLHGAYFLDAENSLRPAGRKPGETFTRKQPNQALQPTRMLVTFCAYAQPAPSTRVADL